MPKLLRVTTVPMALKVLLRGQLRYMKDAGFDVVMVSADGKELEDVKAYEGCRHELVHMTRKITPFADLVSLWKLYRLIKKEKPDIVHSHTPKAGLIAMLAARMAGVRLRVHTIAGLRFMTATGFSRKLMISMEKLTARAASHVWPNSQSLLNYVRDEKLADPGKLSMIGKGSSNGIDLGRFSKNVLKEEQVQATRQTLSYDPRLIYVLAVGRIVKDKGIAELSEAFLWLYEKDDRLRLVLVGSFEEHLDPLDPETMKRIKGHPAILLPGWHDEVEYFMHLADIFVHASHREGFPNVVLQAGAMECPVVCSRIPGNVDIVDADVNGWIFTKADANDLHEKLSEALRDQELSRQRAALLRKKIEENFDRKYVQLKLKERYLQLLADLPVKN